MKKFHLGFIFILIIFAQTLNVSSTQLSFGNVYENAPDSLPITIYNPLAREVTITGLRFYNIYGNPAFSASQTWFSILPGDSAVVWIKFAPIHNIFHNTEMVIENNSLRGCVSVDLLGQGKYSNHYYDQTENKAEELLKTTINTITGNGYISLLYNPARDTMFMMIDNKRTNGQGASQNTLECIYTGRQAVGYTSRTDCQTNFSFNTEHTFPQSFFSSQEPMKSDLHHLFPTDDVANNERADHPFGIVTSPSWSNGGSLSDGTIFEPRDIQKGPSARALFYFVLRYQNYTNFLNSQEAILRTWHQNFPPDAAEKKRNNDIYSVQHNRNPFVDYPVLIDRITSLSSTSVAPVVMSIDIPEDTIVYGTVNPGIPAVYNYVLENIGNTNINFSNFNLTHPAELSFQSSGNDTTIAPGESLKLQIRCLTTVTDSIRAFLSFNTNASGQSSVMVPIFVNDAIFSDIKEVFNEAVIYPNPAQDKIVISTNYYFTNDEAALYDMTGRLVLTAPLEGKNNTLDLGKVAQGVYLLKLTSENSSISKRIIVE
jgi:hypothetical protein